jgi:hypothetical protein
MGEGVGRLLGCMKLPFVYMREPYSSAAYSKERMIIAVNNRLFI